MNARIVKRKLQNTRRKKSLEKAPHINTSLQSSVNSSTNLPKANQLNVLYFIQNKRGGINQYDVDAVENNLKNVTANKELFLVLYTRGGDIYSAVKIMKILQDKFTEIKIVIPDYAYSAGTIMALGGNKIYMDVDATLGPLDKPMEHFSDGSNISSLDITKTLSNIASICTSIGIYTYSLLRDEEDDLRLGKELASRIAFDTAAKLVCPITEKIDPFNLQRGFRESKIGYLYAKDMLKSRMMANNSPQAEVTSNSFVNDYPSHGYGIFRQELKDKLKLDVVPLEELLEWSKIKSEYNTLKEEYIRYINFKVIKNALH
jgi:hypothetical protein